MSTPYLSCCHYKSQQPSGQGRDAAARIRVNYKSQHANHNRRDYQSQKASRHTQHTLGFVVIRAALASIHPLSERTYIPQIAHGRIYRVSKNHGRERGN